MTTKLETPEARAMARDFDARALREIAVAAEQRAHWLTERATEEAQTLSEARKFLRDADSFKMLAAWSRDMGNEAAG